MEIILLTYINRSGSTFLVSRLDNIPTVLSCPEADILVRLFLSNPLKAYKVVQHNLICDILVNDRKFKNWGLTKHEILVAMKQQTNIQIFIELLDAYRKHIKPSAKKIVFKATEIIRFVTELNFASKQKEFSISIFALVRDPRAIFTSQKKTFVPHKGKRMNTNPLNTIYQWNYFVKKLLYNYQLAAISYIKYEDFITDPLFVLSDLSGIDAINNEVLAVTKYFERIQNDEQTMHLNILTPPIPERINAWDDELSVVYKDIISLACKEGLDALGYSNVMGRSTLKLLIVKWYLKTSLILFELRRKLIRPFRGKDHFKTLNHI